MIQNKCTYIIIITQCAVLLADVIMGQIESWDLMLEMKLSHN